MAKSGGGKSNWSTLHKPFQADAENREIVYQRGGDHQVAHHAANKFCSAALQRRLESLEPITNSVISLDFRRGQMPKKGLQPECYTTN
jgi:hypothetical protein